MSCDDEAVEVLRRAGHRVTPQRLLILRALRHARGHVSATQIAEEVRRQFPSIDVSTVYRTLDVLKRMRLVSETDLGTGDTMFEWLPDRPHHHLICTSCQQVDAIDHSYFEALERRLREERGFRPNFDHFAIFGLCRSCAEADDAD